MRHLTRLLITALFAVLLAACGGEVRSQALVGQAQPQTQVGLVGQAQLQGGLVGRAELKTP